MRKTILFPTDFTVESLNLVKKIIEDHPDEKLKLILVHGMHASDSITDLLFFSKSEQIEKLTNPEFEAACKFLQDLYSNQIEFICFDLFTGFTLAAFNNFVEGLNVDKIYFSAAHKYLVPHKESKDITRFFQKCSCVEKVMVPIENAGQNTHTQTVPQFSVIK